MTGGSASTTVDCNVSTNSASGYNLLIHATGSPALVKDGDPTKTFADANTTNFYDWAGTVATNESKFGFAVSSTDAATAFKNNGSACGTGSNISNAYCYRGFNNTTDIIVATRNSETAVSGNTSTLRFMAEVGSAKNQSTGNYRSTVIVTASTN